MRQDERGKRAETSKSEGDGLGFNSINSSESDSHVIIKNLPNFSLTSAKRRGGRKRKTEICKQHKRQIKR